MMQLIFTERVEILRPKRVRGEYGGFVESWDEPEVCLLYTSDAADE